MAMMPYPSNTLIINVDDRILDNELKLALMRSWTHIGEILVRSHAGKEEEQPRNFIHVMVKYGTRKYLSAENKESEKNWSERMAQHLLATMRKISSNNNAFNRRQRKTGNDELVLDYVEFELESGALTLEFRLDSNGGLPPSCAYIASDIRTALNAGILGEALRIRIPSTQSYLQQASANAEKKIVEQKRKREEERVRRLAQEAAQEAIEQEAAEQFMESPELIAASEIQSDDQSQPDSPLEIAPLTAEEWEVEYGDLAVDFIIDYRLWEVIYADGSSREFDSSTQQFEA